jgi:hypothetical protein
MLLGTSTTLAPGSFAVGPMAEPAAGPTALRVPGATLLIAPQVTAAARKPL